ncbi:MULTISPECIES: hypothetical protein [unclassified Crossiella]|uniref:hypothetical protein n=1 Tax=unclassified Crossiella TaxID=2620835 RepID=UPI001FFE33C8|nr:MULTISPECIES: hypothetical protein [unclassified Crossiella]MCK2239169.1 hypothetical protein [Crossiella sp. S99.2]MCK2251262.1 hypothetical protein [Crossiella sp. S99.1]
MDPVTLAVGGGLVLLGYLGGLLSRRKRTPEPPLTADCGCGHSLALHDPEAGTCHAQLERMTAHNKYAGTSYEQSQCPCRQYVGPRPIEEFLAPRYLPPA